jgi:hypothetical protein
VPTNVKCRVGKRRLLTARLCSSDDLANKQNFEARADDTDQGERLGGVHAVLYPHDCRFKARGGWGAGALESKMESSRRVGTEKSSCGNGLLQGSIPPALLFRYVILNGRIPLPLMDRSINSNFRERKGL